jgi:hypothetical protein
MAGPPARAGTAITSRFVAKTTGFSTSPSAKSCSGSFASAAAKRSGRTPERICAASSSLPPKPRRSRASR